MRRRKLGDSSTESDGAGLGDGEGEQYGALGMGGSSQEFTLVLRSRVEGAGVVGGEAAGDGRGVGIPGKSDVSVVLPEVTMVGGSPDIPALVRRAESESMAGGQESGSESVEVISSCRVVCGYG